MKNEEYWKSRQEQLYLQGEKSMQEYYEGLKKSFNQAKREIHNVVNQFYIQYATENGISFAEAQRRLTKAEIGKLKDYIDLVKVHIGEFDQEVSNLSIKARMTRYQALEMQIDAILQNLYGVDYEGRGNDMLKNVYSESYYRTWYNIDTYHGFHSAFAQLNPYDIDQLILYPFNGKNFSQRLWGQKAYLKDKILESLTMVMVQGADPARLSKDFAKHFGAREQEAYRLLHTETSFVIEQGTLAGYQADEVPNYIIIATLDMKTSDICRGMDGRVFPVKKAVVGVNYPPFHSYCRTTTGPQYDDKPENGTRMARDPKTGKAYEVPARMTYKEWNNKYIIKI